MKNQIETVAAKNNQESAFEISKQLFPQSASGSSLKRFSAACVEKLRALKESVVGSLAAEFAGSLNPEIVRQMVNEAGKLAALTPFPTLFLPALAEEKVVLAARSHVKPHRVSNHSLRLAA